MNEKEVNAPKKKHTGKIVLVGLLIACVVIYFAVPSVHTWINNVVAMFKSGDFDQMRNFIAKYGKWAMLVSAFLMVFQSIAAPLPAFFITLTNANLFGWWQGCILGVRYAGCRSMLLYCSNPGKRRGGKAVYEGRTSVHREVL